MTRSRIRIGWSRTSVEVDDADLVVDIGSGAFPHPRADLLCDLEIEDDRHRAGLPAVIDRPLVRADVTALPFRDDSIQFVIVSHLAEHVTDPAAMCTELRRVARRGYIETPSPIADWLLDEDYHLWRVRRSSTGLDFHEKAPKSAVAKWFTDRFYRAFYAAQPSCHRPVYRLPSGRLGRAIRLGLTATGAALNRSGLMHTRCWFEPNDPLIGRVIHR